MTYTIKIKNDSGAIATWCGKEFTVAEEYTVPSDGNRSKWVNNSDLITAISTGDALVGDGGVYFSDVSTAINWLKGILDPITEVSGIKDPKSYRARLKGIANGTVTKTTTKDFDYKMEQLAWIGVNKVSYFDGIQYHAKDAIEGDTISFQVVDVDGLVYPAGTVLDEFGEDWGIIPDSDQVIRLFKSKIMPNFYIRMKYTSVGTVNDVKFLCNLFRFLKTDEDA